MRYLALACDYDGTLATHGVVDTATARALERCRQSGRKLLMVTGRELPELQAICPYLDLFEWIVAENGALLFRPATRQEIALAPPPTPEFVMALKQRGVQRISIGRVIVATWEPHETTVLKTIRDLGLELQVIFNKGAVMILPSGINKATGLQRALTEMGLSPHNVVSVGDAENDHALLAGSEAGAAVANAVELLKEHADLVTKKTHGAGVEEVVVQLIDDDLVELDAKLSRHHLLLGKDENGKEFFLSPYRSNIIIAEPRPHGEKLARGAKSAVAAAFIERLVEKCYQVCVIDPGGRYGDEPECVSIGTVQQPPTIDAILKLLSAPAQSVVVNLRGLPQEKRSSFLLALVHRLSQLRLRLGRPHWLVIDQAERLFPHDYAAEDFGKGQLSNRTLLIATDPLSVAASMFKTADLIFASGAATEQTIRQVAAAKRIDPPTIDTTLLEMNGSSDKHLVVVWQSGKPRAQLVEIAPRQPPSRRCAGQSDVVQKAGQ